MKMSLDNKMPNGLSLMLYSNSIIWKLKTLLLELHVNENKL